VYPKPALLNGDAALTGGISHLHPASPEPSLAS